MGNETLFATKGYQSVIRWVDPSISIEAYIIQRTLSVGGDTAVAGDIMSGEGETQGLVDIAAESDLGFIGVLLGPVRPADGYDLDDAIVDGTTVNILRPTGGRTIIAVINDSTTTAAADFEEGDWARIGSSAGHVEKWLYADTADSTDSFSIVVGKAAETKANHTTDDQVVTLWY
jgi:hypothetical protein